MPNYGCRVHMDEINFCNVVKQLNRFIFLNTHMQLNEKHYYTCSLIENITAHAAQPIKVNSHFFRPILLKIAGNVHNGKNRIPLFWFLCKMKDNEDTVFAFEYFRVFLTVHGCLTSEDYKLFTVHRIEHREFKSVEISCLSLLFLEIEAFIFLQCATTV